MIVVLIIALAAIAYRIYKRTFTRVEAAVLALFAVNFIVIWLQSAICDHVFLPERRYWIESAIVLSGWTVWGIRELMKLKLKLVALIGRWFLPICVVCLAITDIAMLVKPYIRSSRRYANIAAVNWAAVKIREDWKGPARDESLEFCMDEYYHPGRPSIRSHSARLPLLLGGRKDYTVRQLGGMMPDYVCNEESKIELDQLPFTAANYEILDRLSIGKRRYILYKRQP